MIFERHVFIVLNEISVSAQSTMPSEQMMPAAIVMDRFRGSRGSGR